MLSLLLPTKTRLLLLLATLVIESGRGCMYLNQEVILNSSCKQMVEIRLGPALRNVSSANAGAGRAHSGHDYL